MLFYVFTKIVCVRSMMCCVLLRSLMIRFGDNRYLSVFFFKQYSTPNDSRLDLDMRGQAQMVSYQTLI